MPALPETPQARRDARYPRVITMPKSVITTPKWVITMHRFV
jgi:hypothetical protein